MNGLDERGLIVHLTFNIGAVTFPESLSIAPKSGLVSAGLGRLFPKKSVVIGSRVVDNDIIPYYNDGRCNANNCDKTDPPGPVASGIEGNEILAAFNIIFPGSSKNEHTTARSIRGAGGAILQNDIVYYSTLSLAQGQARELFGEVLGEEFFGMSRNV